MSTEIKYEGWTNRETWRIALEIDNDQTKFGLVLNMREHCREGFEFVELLKTWHEDTLALQGCAEPWGDMARIALDRVDWREIEEHYTAKLADCVGGVA